ncbi:MAG: bifunctional precorrin-2 dehydrogenase/sirohydrochlorin ferrochelatase [Desulfobacterales bacterium]|nr:bifunctional precorrin-2 dehydrogenase/sirohydrochlorin ferrochelatase [Desulfobacterales bacterium]
MKYYPIQLDVREKKCLIIGGGSVGTRKAATLINCGAKVTIVSPEITDVIESMSTDGMIQLQKREYQSSDIHGMFLVIGATNNEILNRQISNDAQEHNIPCNIVDRPELCSFILPAIVEQGDLTITISTSGQSPAFAKHLRRELEKQFGHEYAIFLKCMGEIRKYVLNSNLELNTHQHIFETVIQRGLLDLIRQHQYTEINTLLHDLHIELDSKTLIELNIGENYQPTRKPSKAF